jgi:Peptidase family C25
MNRILAILMLPLTLALSAFSQRTYLSNSVLASGNFYKISVKQAGIYKVDINLLQSLGINTGNIPSASVRLYGNGGQMLAERNATPRPDDLTENAIQVVDGGDGQLNGNDYFLFYAPGPNRWIRDSLNKTFQHEKNLFSDESFYFISIGGTGKRVAGSPALGPATIPVNSFQYLYYHELDSLNFLASGKQWFGEEFSDLPGRTLSKAFSVSIPNLLIAEPLKFATNCVARAAGNNSRFTVSVNNIPVQQHNIPFTNGGIYDNFARSSQIVSDITVAQNNLSIGFLFSPGSINGQGWLDWFEIQARSQLSLNGLAQFTFRDWNSVGVGNRGGFTIRNAGSGVQVWDITEPASPQNMPGTLTGTDFNFVGDCSRLREYACFNGNSFFTPSPIGRINNQDLHNSATADFLVVTHSALLSEAQRLAAYHTQRDNLRCVVVTTDQVFQEFASGSPDPTAIRDFVKMYYDKAGADISKRPKYLLLFGDASYDYKNRLNNNTNLVPAYESVNSLDPLATYVSDDFFGFLDDVDDINSFININLLDIGTGRIPARNTGEAKAIVDKIIAYTAKESFGPWRNQFSFVADDEDFNLHLQDAEIITNTTTTAAPLFNIEKIYLDAFRQEGGSGGSRYPSVNEAINNRIFSGTLIWNYNGHGGFRRLAEESVLDQEMVNGWNNVHKLPLFITATCDFAPYDNPGISSIGENILLREKTGGIALMTTTRVVFAFSNRIMNNNYLQLALQPDASGVYPTLGQAVQAGKNFTYQTFGDITNNRKFTLLGDPALRLGFPSHRVTTTSVNGITTSAVPDTIKALNKYTIAGAVTDIAGNVLTNYNGTAYPVIYDKKQSITTLANDPGSSPVVFQSQTNIIYKGKVEVSSGLFSFTFIAPKDINYQFGAGRIGYYAEDGVKDANGTNTNIIIGGAGTGANSDKDGPVMKAFLNDEKFVDGGLTNASPVLLVNLSDSSGINTVGVGIGHDITATLDNNNRNIFVLNDFYEAALNSYQRGSIRFQLPALSEGPHTLTIKAWDVANNSATYTLSFYVAADGELRLDHVLNYPNPFTTRTNFWFEHNRPRQNLDVLLQIYTVTGRIIKSSRYTINTPGNRSSEIEWDGKDDFGNNVGRGVYIYRILVKTSDGKSAGKLEKLVIL